MKVFLYNIDQCNPWSKKGYFHIEEPLKTSPWQHREAQVGPCQTAVDFSCSKTMIMSVKEKKRIEAVNEIEIIT
jgi:hypothetical protein